MTADNKLNVLLIVRWPVGGIRTYLRYIYGNDIFRNIKITLLAPDLDLAGFLDEHIRENINFISVENSTFSLWKASRQLIKTSDFDIVHSHGFSAGIITQLAKGLKATPHLMTAHDVFVKYQFLGFRGYLKRCSMSIVFKRIDAIHTVTNDAENNFLEFFPGVDKKRVHSIHHGIDTDYFASAASIDIRQQMNIEPSRPVIGFFGRFMSQKGFRYLVKAIQELVDQNILAVNPVIVTFGWGGYIREDYDFLVKLGLEDYFVQAPHQDNIAAALKSVDLIVMPSLWEACGLLAMEAMAAGVPIIGTSCIGLSEVLEGSPASVVTPKNHQELAEAIRDNLENSRNQAFADYQSVAVDRFAIERPAKGLYDLYQQLTSKDV